MGTDTVEQLQPYLAPGFLAIAEAPRFGSAGLEFGRVGRWWGKGGHRKTGGATSEFSPRLGPVLVPQDVHLIDSPKLVWIKAQMANFIFSVMYLTASLLLLGMHGTAQVQNPSPYELYLAAKDGSSTSLQRLTELAEQGDADAQFDLGVMYENGEGVRKNAVRAASWYRKAADQGSAEAQNNLGTMYEIGSGVQESLRQAMALYRKAADQEYTDALHNWRRLTQKQLIPLEQRGGVYAVPVLINNAITLKFIVDSGASDVSIPADVVFTLMRAGTIAESDFLDTKEYTLGDGSKTSSRRFRIRSLKVGDRVLNNVTASMSSTNGDLLLGQSFLNRFASWTINNQNHSLSLDDGK